MTTMAPEILSWTEQPPGLHWLTNLVESAVPDVFRLSSTTLLGPPKPGGWSDVQALREWNMVGVYEPSRHRPIRLSDPLARQLLLAWYRQPWQEAHWAALADRLQEIGAKPDLVADVLNRRVWVEHAREAAREFPRRRFAAWKRDLFLPALVVLFGEDVFGPNYDPNDDVINDMPF